MNDQPPARDFFVDGDGRQCDRLSAVIQGVPIQILSIIGYNRVSCRAGRHIQQLPINYDVVERWFRNRLGGLSTYSPNYSQWSQKLLTLMEERTT